jgi:uncharacterized alkaline shock family protein YloU
VTAHASYAADVLARYAADAALESPGVTGLVPSRAPRAPHKGVRIVADSAAAPRVELWIAVSAATTLPDVAADVRSRVADYLERMAGLRPAAVDVTVASIGA